MDAGAEPTVITGRVDFSGATQGIVMVRSGGSLTITGNHQGSVDVTDGGRVTVSGALNGSVEIGSLGTVSVTGDVVGRVDIKVAGTLVVEAGGRLAGPVANRGSFTNRGYRYGPVEGRTPDDRPGAEVGQLPTGGAPVRYQLAERS